MPESSVVFIKYNMRFCIYFNDHPVPHVTVETTSGKFRYKLEDLSPMDTKRATKGMHRKIMESIYEGNNYERLWEKWDRHATPPRV